MKIRLAKKIMRQGHCCDKKKLSFHWMSLYWVVRWNRLDMQTWSIKPELKGKIDHRIIKAISLTSKKK